MREAVIVNVLRTATGRRDGALSAVHPVDMLVPVLQQLIHRNEIDANVVEDVITGCATMTDEQGGNIGRMATLAAGLPVEIPAFSLNRMCGSSQEALHSASQAILAGDVDVAIACGVENMKHISMVSDIITFSNNILDRYNMVLESFLAELIAQKWVLTLEELYAISLESQQQSIQETDYWLFEREILPLTLK